MSYQTIAIQNSPWLQAISAELRAWILYKEGTVLTRPTLLISDGTNLTYGCDVDIGQKMRDPTNPRRFIVKPLKNVPISAGAREVIYAEVGAAVTLKRNVSGKFEITGFSKRRPGTYHVVEVAIVDPGITTPSYTIGTTTSIGVSARPLTYIELSTIGGGYGTAPYGATGVFDGAGNLIGLSS